MENEPSSAESAVNVVPCTWMCARPIGSPVVATTCPVILRCADALGAATANANAANSSTRLIPTFASGLGG
jgi:hypothetical protein